MKYSSPLVWICVTTCFALAAAGNFDFGPQCECVLSCTKKYSPTDDAYYEDELAQAAKRAKSFKRLGNRDYIAAESRKSISNDRPSGLNWKLMDVEEAISEMKSVNAKALVNKKECGIEGVADHVVKSVVDRLLSTQNDVKSKIMGLIETGGKNIVYVRDTKHKGFYASKRKCEALGGKMAEEITKEDFDRLHDVMYFQGAKKNNMETSYFVGAQSSMKEGEVDDYDRTRSSFTWLSGKPVDENVWISTQGTLWFDDGIIQFKDPKVSYKRTPGGFTDATSFWSFPVLCQFD